MNCPAAHELPRGAAQTTFANLTADNDLAVGGPPSAVILKGDNPFPND
jgi:hypothetical protein